MLLSRRWFVQYCAVGGCGALAALTSGPAAALAPATGSDQDAAVVVGEWYLQIAPEEADPARLAALLQRAVPEFAVATKGDEFCCDAEALRKAFAEDYARGDTVYLGGWLFARTELRLCALAAIA